MRLERIISGEPSGSHDQEGIKREILAQLLPRLRIPELKDVDSLRQVSAEILQGLRSELNIVGYDESNEPELFTALKEFEELEIARKDLAQKTVAGSTETERIALADKYRKVWGPARTTINTWVDDQQRLLDGAF